MTVKHFHLRVALLAEFHSAFETSELFQLIDKGTEDSLTRALELILDGNFDPALRGSSQSPQVCWFSFRILFKKMTEPPSSFCP